MSKVGYDAIFDHRRATYMAVYGQGERIWTTPEYMCLNCTDNGTIGKQPQLESRCRANEILHLYMSWRQSVLCHNGQIVFKVPTTAGTFTKNGSSSIFGPHYTKRRADRSFVSRIKDNIVWTYQDIAARCTYPHSNTWRRQTLLDRSTTRN